MQNDEWTLKDRLGHNLIVDTIINSLEQVSPPFTLGVYGGWGSGKTSIMRQVFYKIGGSRKEHFLRFDENCLEESMSVENLKCLKEIMKTNQQSKFEAIWFNPWRHETDGSPILGLLHEIRDNYDLSTKIVEGMDKATAITIRSGLDILSSAITAMTKVDVSVSNIERKGEAYENRKFITKSESQNFRIIFEAAIKKLVGKEKNLVVFIDDLDRCSDRNVTEMLDGIKLYLSTSNCIFIFGMDQSNVISVLEKQNINRDYLDKLFQSTIRIPVSKRFTKTFIPDLVRSSLESGLTGGAVTTYYRMLGDILEPNPRKIKNFINSLDFHWKLVEGKALDIKKFTLFHYLRVYHEDVFEVLEREPKKLADLISVCKDENPNTKVEAYFEHVFQNPLTKSIQMKSNEESKGELTALDVSLSTEELCSLLSIRTRIYSFNKFKEHFRDQCGAINSDSILDYLGVIR